LIEAPIDLDHDLAHVGAPRLGFGLGVGPVAHGGYVPPQLLEQRDELSDLLLGEQVDVQFDLRSPIQAESRTRSE
jgi:hypothetical protein